MDNLIGVSPDGQTKSQYEQALTTYVTHVQDEKKQLKILGKPERLFNIEDVYIQTRLQNQDDETVTVYPSKIFEKDSRLLVSGLPGSGKSTLLQYIAYETSKERSIPLYFRAKRFVSHKSGSEGKKVSLQDFLTLYLQGKIGEGSARAILHSESFGKSNTILLIDGIDEITPEQRVQINEELDDFLLQHEQAKVVITSRFGRFDETAYRTMEFGIYRLMDVHPNDIESYVKNACDKEIQEGILSSIRGDERLMEMAGNPFLLAMMCCYPSNLAPIATKRASLFKVCTEYLLRKEDYQKGRERPASSFSTLEKALEIMGIYFFKLDEKEPLRIEEVKNCLTSAIKNKQIYLEGEKTDQALYLLNQISQVSGLIQISEGEEECEFVHRSIWEYFVARAMKYEPKDNIFNKVYDPSWEESIRFYVGLMDEKSLFEIISGIWERNRGLALRALNERDIFPSELLIKLYNPLKMEEKLEVLTQLKASVRLSQGNPLRQKRLILDTLSSILQVEKDCRILYECILVLEERKEPKCKNLIDKALLLDLEPIYERRNRVMTNSGSSKQKFVEIPRGTFNMGTNSSMDPRESPEHQVQLTSFKMSACPVTNQMYYGSNFPYATDRRNAFSNENDQPVNNVNWYEAYVFSRWLGCDLPTEAEWEYACRCGGKDDVLFSDVKNLEDHAWYDKNSDNKSQPVGTKKTNSFGLYDMLGNLREWCKDWYSDDYYSDCKEIAINPQGPREGEQKVLRGGCFDWADTHLRPTYRNYNLPLNVYFANGFRLVLRGE